MLARVTLVSLVLVGAGSLAAADSIVAVAQKDPAGVTFAPQVDYERMVLTVALPTMEVWRGEFVAGKTIRFTAATTGGADGTYTWELVVAPKISDEAKESLRRARETGDMTDVEKLLIDGKLPKAGLVQSGTFSVSGGSVVLDQEEPRRPTTASSRDAAPRRSGTPPPASGGAGGPAPTSAGPRPNDQVIADDLIVTGGVCSGADCVNGEDLAFMSLKAKENNMSIRFEDTSTGSFPSTDWALTPNETTSGGANKFSITDITAARTPFTVEGGATTNSVYVDSSGKVGFRTATPVLDLHPATGNTPALRLEQNASSGFTAQTWDVAGNEANFFVRDVTAGSRLPFRIIPGAPTNSLRIESDGEVTMGGDVTIAGVLNQGSSRAIKTAFSLVDGRDLVSRLAALPILTWSYTNDRNGSVHLGPTAEDFHLAFGLGADDAHIAPSDAAGIALAASQELACALEAKDGDIARLSKENEELAARVARLEEAIERLSRGDSNGNDRR